MQFRNEFFFLSNMYPCSIEIQGIHFTCAESAFQAMKCVNEKDVLALSKMSGASAKRYGRTVSLRADWNKQRVNAMRYVLNVKFKNPELKSKLLSTGNLELVEDNDWNDRFWGRCNGIGANQLGKLLMEIRDNLQS